MKLIGHHLAPETYGAVLVAMQVTAFLPLLDGGVRTVSNRRMLALPEAAAKARLVRFGVVFYSRLAPVVLAVAIVLMGGYALTPAGRLVDSPPAFWLAVGVTGALTMLAGAQAALLVGLGQQTRYFLMNGAAAWLSVLGLWLALHLGAGVWAFPLAALVVLAVGMPLTIWLIRRSVPDFRWWRRQAEAGYPAQLQELKRDAWDCFRSQLATMLLFTGDVVLAGLICGATKEAAIYGVLARLFGILRSLSQATAEVVWPMMARDAAGMQSLADFVLRANAWVYGAAVGGMGLTLGPFMGWWMGPEWLPAPALVVLLTARFLITGVSAPAAYYLIGQGNFLSLAQLVERELVVAVLLAVAAGLAWGVKGVAAGFLLATVAGTLGPTLTRYARSVPQSPGSLAGELWWRALTGLAVSLGVAALLTPLAGRGAGLVLVGTAAAVAGLGMGGLVAWSRVTAPAEGGLSWPRFRAMLRVF
ncbi:MAG: hypothetical protein FJW31_18085 [Acidobacteria bacterium]|nr:hypothetical protein [Acidobacteriota bacterium]